MIWLKNLLAGNTANTPFEVFFGHHWLNMPHFGWPCFMFVKVRNYPATNFTAEDFRIQGSSCQLCLWMSRDLGYTWIFRHVSYQKGTIQGHPGHRYATRAVLQDRVSGCILTRCMHPDCFPISHFRKGYFEGLYLMFFVSMLRTGCYANTNFQPFIGYRYGGTGES